MLRRSILILGLAVLPLGEANQVSAKAKAEQAPKTSGLTIGMDPTYFPMAYLDKGQMAGYDADYARALAKRLGRSLTIVQMDYDKILDAVAQGKLDAGISALEIVPGRSDVRFIEYFAIPEALVGKTSRGFSEDPDLSTSTVGAGSVSAARVIYHLRMNQGQVAKVKGFESDAALFDALDRDQVDAIVVHQPTAERRVTKSEGKLQVLATNVARQPLGIAVAQTNNALASRLLDAVIALKDDGTQERLGAVAFGQSSNATGGH